MNILDEIVKKTKIRVEKYKSENDIENIKSLAVSILNKKYQFEEELKKEGMSFICEVKKASPSKGIIAENFKYLDTAKEYETAGANAISVLTEPDFFMGSSEYLKEIAQNVQIPVLKKDFIIDEIQIYEAKITGAGAVLLICSILDDIQIKNYIKTADKLGLSALVEAHDEFEIKKAINAGARIIGVNNRDLKTFKVDINNSIKLRKFVPDNILFVSESGIKTHEQIEELEKNKVNAVLIGETFMKSENKTLELRKLRYGEN